MLLSKCVQFSLKLREQQLVINLVARSKHSQLTLKYSTSIPIGKQNTTAMDSGEDQNPVLRIAKGSIRGTKRITIYDDVYYGFEGIPYGHPPLGELRFKSPKPANSWKDVRDCSDSVVKPLQKNFQGEIEGSEDCLYLNVYAKTLNTKEKLPVMVWIYGGAFNTGSCIRPKYGPDYFMQEDVILVTFNYRLSVFGFLSFSDPSLAIPGNAGLKDQILALKWVRENISFFGGNKDNVTLFGESAGAASVHYMMCTDNAKGLFHKAICMSGCILNNWAWRDNGTELPYCLACEKGYTGPKDDRLVLEYLQTLTGPDLLRMDKLNEEACAKGGFFAFLPSTEPYDNEDSIIRKPLVELMKTSWANDIPLIVGGTSFEGLLRYPTIKHHPSFVKSSKEVPEMMLPSELLAGKSEEEKKTMLHEIISVYFKESGANQQEDIMSFLDYYTFRAFWHDLHRLVKSRQLHSSAPTYQYLFDFDSPTFNHHRKMFCGTDIEKGVAHADDLAYIFYSFYSWKLERDSKEYLTLRRMVKMWTQFAKNCNPNCEYTKKSEWRTVEETTDSEWLKISNDLTFEKIDENFMKKLEVWNKLYGYKLL